jgi:hypothetical protein
MVYDNKPRRNLFVDRKFRIQVCSQTILDIYENVMLYNNKIFSIFFDIFFVDKMLLICQQKKFRPPKKCPTIFPKKKLCSQNENFLKSFVTLIFFSVTNVKKLPRLFSKKKKWTKNVQFFKKPKTLLKNVNYLMSLYIQIVGHHVGV